MRTIKIIALLLGFFPMQLLAQQQTIPLDTILKRIDENNPLLKSYALKAESYKHRQMQARLGWHP